MKFTRNLFSVVLLTASFLGTQAPPRMGSVEGTVRNLKTGEAIADVRIALTPEFGGSVAKSGTTDANGSFSISAVPPGRYQLLATRTLFYRPTRDGGPAVVEVREAEQLRDLKLFLSPTGVIAGRVVDDNRSPLRSVRVEALRSEYRNGVRTWVTAGQNTTDDRGEYRLFNLPPGTYYVRATASDSPAVYYPGVNDSLTASPITIAAGTEASAIDVPLVRLALYTAQFKLSGIPPGSEVLFTVQRRGAAREVQVARPEALPDNAYRISKLAPGDYDIFARVMSPVGTSPRVVTHAVMFPLRVGRSDQDLGTIAATPTVSVTGRIVVPEPLPSALDPQRLTLVLSSMDLAQAVTAVVRGNTTPAGFNPDGTFILNNVIPGRYLIQMNGLPANTYLTSAREGAREVLDAGFTVNGSQGSLDVVIGGPQFIAGVQGVVVDVQGRPVPSSTVVLIPSAERRANPSAFKTATADQQGIFLIRAMPPGDYRVLAWEEIQAGLYWDPEFLKNYETRGERIRLLPGSQSSVSVRVIPTPD